MDMATNVVYAVGRPDSVGELQGSPVFSDKSGEYESKTMSYNFKTKRGMITDVVTEQGEGYLTGGRTKMMESGEYYLADGKYSTCDDHDNPHFYFQLTKAKVIPKRMWSPDPPTWCLQDFRSRLQCRSAISLLREVLFRYNIPFVRR